VTVIEPKGDLAEKIFAMARYYNREVQYFNPILPDCPYFNPLFGDESDVIENMATTFKMLNPDSPQFFLDMNENLIRNALKVLKRLYGDDATLIDLSTLLHNTGGGGKKMVQDFSKLPSESDSMAKENNDIALWFLNDYFTGATGDKGATKTYEHCSGVRSQVAKLVSNKYLRRVLNPPKGRGSDVDFDKSLAEGTIITIATAQGKLRDLGKYLGYFIILQLQSAVFRRPGNENTRRGNMLYIDEFQTYSNPGFADMLTQGRSYRVASHLATQNRALIGMGSGKDGKDFIELVSTNARNTIIYPGGNAQDADYYSKQFGEIIEKTMQKGYSQEKFSVLGGLGRRPVNESFREAEETKARYSATDIIYREFGQITYCLIKNNSIQAPGVSKIEYIPKEL
ncbi:TraM recognition domain-containing protein, partial [Bacillus thuringiensis]|nr:TraM recognition domain-containing protein [Bacillus thuringiensis]